MNPGSVVFHPAFLEAIEARAELDKERINLQMVLEPQTFERVRAIVEAQDTRKRAAFYGTICEAARTGEDFSHVESIQDIGEIYARFIIRRSFYSLVNTQPNSPPTKTKAGFDFSMLCPTI